MLTLETNAKGEKKKRRKRGYETKREALEYERQKKLSNSRSMDMKLSEFMEVYFDDKQNELKERTMRNKWHMMEQHIIPWEIRVSRRADESRNRDYGRIKSYRPDEVGRADE